ncbi:hypothetical protein C8Q77DRAFT_1058798 [Trametes polyzona]|nr:hypothetical protein C8Q77DRAFT_1058798 [Trametes polyzona]
MHPFGGTPVCPRCTKAVYAAEQIMGPGRKPCLACKSCGKRLDSLNLLEHDEEASSRPSSKNCHVKLFGTRDLRQANLPHRDEVLNFTPPSSPLRANSFGTNRAASPPALPARNTPNTSTAASRTNGTAPPLPVRRHATGGGSLDRRTSPPPMLLKPTRTLSPNREQQRSRPASLLQATEQMQALREVGEEKEQVEAGESAEREPVESQPPPPITPTHVGRGAGGLPRTIPLNANAAPRTVTLPLAPSMTGTRYGAALGGSVPVLAPSMTGASPGAGRQWGGGTPRCGRCGQAVYFAEQVKAVGKTWHKGCLRCTECGHTLDSGRLADKEGEPFCHRCYGKRFGPQGSGYALLGKPGG